MSVRLMFDPAAVYHEPGHAYDPDDDHDDHAAALVREEVGKRLNADPRFAGRDWWFSVYRAGLGSYLMISGDGSKSYRKFPADSTVGWVADRVEEVLRHRLGGGGSKDEPNQEWKFQP